MLDNFYLIRFLNEQMCEQNVKANVRWKKIMSTLKNITVACKTGGHLMQCFHIENYVRQV